MEKSKKIFIVLRNVDDNQQLATYGLEVSRQLKKPSCLFAVQHVHIPTETLVQGAMVSEYPLLNNIEELTQKTTSHLNHLKQQLCKNGEECEVRVEIGFIEDVLVSQVGNEASMLIIGKQSELSFLNQVMGTFEARIAEQVAAPVLVVPENQQFSTVHNIAYVADFSEENLGDLKRLNELAIAFGAKITILTVWEEDKESDYIASISELQNMISSGYVRYQKIDKESAATNIHEYVKQHGIDWLAFHSTDESFFQRIYSNFNTEHLILEQEIPVLVF